MNEYISHYETLSYDERHIHASHNRAKRSITKDPHVFLKFKAHGRNFHIRLKRDISTFSDSLVVSIANVNASNVPYLFSNCNFTYRSIVRKVSFPLTLHIYIEAKCWENQIVWSLVPYTMVCSRAKLLQIEMLITWKMLNTTFRTRAILITVFIPLFTMKIMSKMRMHIDEKVNIANFNVFYCSKLYRPKYSVSTTLSNFFHIT